MQKPITMFHCAIYVIAVLLLFYLILISPILAESNPLRIRIPPHTNHAAAGISDTKILRALTFGQFRLCHLHPFPQQLQLSNMCAPREASASIRVSKDSAFPYALVLRSSAAYCHLHCLPTQTQLLLLNFMIPEFAKRWIPLSMPVIVASQLALRCSWKALCSRSLNLSLVAIVLDCPLAIRMIL